MNKNRLTQTQIIVLVLLAILDCCVVTCLGSIIMTQTLNRDTNPAQAIPQAADTSVATAPTVTMTPPPTLTPRPAPPTWTPNPTATPVGWDKLYTFHETYCPFLIPMGQAVTCGDVYLPETRGESPLGIVKLAVSIYHSRSANPAPDPVLYLSGGPGGEAVEMMIDLYYEFISPLLEERDVIVFDQRGTGISEPSLICLEYENVVEKDLAEILSSEEKSEAYQQAFRHCQNRWSTRGVNLAAYTSAENASDINDLVYILGYEQINLYGVSYGTRLALTVMRDYPDIVRSAVLDSVVPIEMPMYNDLPRSTDHLLNNIFTACANDARCAATYPNLEDTYYALLDQLDAAPVELWASSPGNKMYYIKINGTKFLSGLFGAAYYTELLPYIPSVIANTANGDYEMLEWFVGIAVNVQTHVQSVGMTLSVECHEEIFATTVDAMREDFERYPHVAELAYQSTFGDPSTVQTICEEWGAAPFDPIEGQPVISDIPTLVLAGEFDPITPVYYAQTVADTLLNSYFFEFPAQGHGVSLWQSECAANIARTFVIAPWAVPDANCIANMPAIRFAQ